MTTVSMSDALDLLDKAINSKNGIRITVHDHAAAITIRHRSYLARTKDRRANAKIFPPGNPMHNASVYDPITITIKEVDDGFALDFRLHGLDLKQTIKAIDDLPEPDFAELDLRTEDLDDE